MFFKRQWFSLLMFFCCTVLGISTAINTDRNILAAVLCFVGGLCLSGAIYSHLLDKALILLHEYHALLKTFKRK